MQRDEARKAVEALVNKYRSLSTLEINACNEENTKNGFILPLFHALGCDT